MPDSHVFLAVPTIASVRFSDKRHFVLEVPTEANYHFKSSFLKEMSEGSSPRTSQHFTTDAHNGERGRGKEG